MIIQAFIPDWNSPRTDALGLYRAIKPFCDTTILSAYDVPFSLQWEDAVSDFTGDVFLWAMADTRLNPAYSYRDLFDVMHRVYSRGDVASYAPNLDWTAMTYDTTKLPQVEPGVFEVAGTDLVFVSMHKELLSLLPPLAGNTHAWAYDYLTTSIAHTINKKVVRDYNFMIDHPYGKAYSEPEAVAQQDEWIRGLPSEHQQGIREQQESQARTCA